MIKRVTKNKCSNSNLFIKYHTTPSTLTSSHIGTFCYCREKESGIMVECGKCRDWFHDECINLTLNEMKSILIYFCPCCLKRNDKLKIIYKDYSKEHTKPLFKLYTILSVHNLYLYHILLEMYKILKFQSPYCLYELFNKTKSDRTGLSISHPDVPLSKQKQIFIFEENNF